MSTDAAQLALSVGDSKPRQDWLSILARAEPADLDAFWDASVDAPPHDWLRRPQSGLVMVRGRMGGDGNPFNLGEMTITRCALRLPDGTVGIGYVQGRNHRHAERAARLDALLQHPFRRDSILNTIIEPLRVAQAERRLDASRKAAATKVQFFTLVRGTDLA